MEETDPWCRELQNQQQIAAERERTRLKMVRYELGLKDKSGDLEREGGLEPRGSRERNTVLLEARLT